MLKIIKNLMDIGTAKDVENTVANAQKQQDLNEFFAMMLDIDIEPEEGGVENE